MTYEYTDAEKALLEAERRSLQWYANLSRNQQDAFDRDNNFHPTIAKQIEFLAEDGWMLVKAQNDALAYIETVKLAGSPHEVCGCSHGCNTPLTGSAIGAIVNSERRSLCDRCFTDHCPTAPNGVPQRPVITADWIAVMGAPLTRVDVTVDLDDTRIFVDQTTLDTMARTIKEAGLFTDEDAQATADHILASAKSLNGPFAQLFDVTDCSGSFTGWLGGVDEAALEVIGVSL